MWDRGGIREGTGSPLVIWHVFSALVFRFRIFYIRISNLNAIMPRHPQIFRLIVRNEVARIVGRINEHKKELDAIMRAMRELGETRFG